MCVMNYYLNVCMYFTHLITYLLFVSYFSCKAAFKQYNVVKNTMNELELKSYISIPCNKSLQFK